MCKIFCVISLTIYVKYCYLLGQIKNLASWQQNFKKEKEKGLATGTKAFL